MLEDRIARLEARERVRDEALSELAVALKDRKLDKKGVAIEVFEKKIMGLTNVDRVTVSAETWNAMREALMNARGLWGHRCTDAVQTAWLFELDRALARLDAEAKP